MPRPARSSPARSDQISREIDRDESVVLLALRRRLQPILARARALTPTLEAVASALAEAREHARRLNDARIIRRGERPQTPADPAPPPALAGHACHGEYLGAFADLAAVGRMALETCPEDPVLRDMSESSLTDLALGLHLRGALWTLEHAGEVHVFRCRDYGSGSQTKR